ncbi:flocculation protein FLO11-like [Nicotiana sylvestris]|uniref:flocculation protein FLO11-like n=1 Tax=Nicotiana sylvestris TaxID=4096 RepID=UPI00388CD068
MGDVEPIPNFRGWVDSLLKIASREQRTWKSISSLHGWKVKTHGFGIRGMTAEVAMVIRMSANAALDLDKARALLPKKKATKESSEEEDEGTSLITRPRIRRRIIIDDEIENTPARTSATEPVLIQSDEDAEPRDNNESIQHLFESGFGSGELGPVFDEAPLSSFVPISSIPLPTVSISLPVLTTSVLLPVSTAPIFVPLAVSSTPASAPVLVSTSFPSILSTAPLPSVHHTETGSSSGSMTMRSVTLEVPANHSLLRKTGRADVWFEPLIGDIEKKNMESHSCLTLMNDVVHSTLKSADTPSPALEVPGTEELLNEEVNTVAIGITIPASAKNVAIPASEGETSMTQSVEIEAFVTLVSLIDPNISSSAEIVPVAASSEVATVPVAESEINIATSDKMSLEFVTLAVYVGDINLIGTPEDPQEGFKNAFHGQSVSIKYTNGHSIT